MEHSYFNLMLYLFQEDCKQPESYKVGLLNIHMIQDKTIQQTISHSFTHSLIIVNTNYIFNSHLKYLQSIESIEIYCYFQWIHIHTMLSSIDKSSLPWRKSSTKYVFNSFLKLFKFTFGQSNDLILWKSVFLNSSYLSQLNKRSCGKYIRTLLSQKPLQSL